MTQKLGYRYPLNDIDPDCSFAFEKADDISDQLGKPLTLKLIHLVMLKQDVDDPEWGSLRWHEPFTST